MVEDTADIRDLLAEILSGEGYEVVAAANGADALQLLQTTPFAVVLLDLMMPVMNGFDLLARLRAGGPHPPVVAMSAFERFRAEAVDLGAASFLCKPVDIERLLEEIHRAVHATAEAAVTQPIAVAASEARPSSTVQAVLRKLEGWLAIEKASYRVLPQSPSGRASLLVLGDASSEETVPGGFYARLGVSTGDGGTGILELADGEPRELSGEDLALAHFVAEWIGREARTLHGEADSNPADDVWGPRLTDLLVSALFENARRHALRMVLAIVRPPGPDEHAFRISQLPLAIASCAFAGWRTSDEIVLVARPEPGAADVLAREVEHLGQEWADDPLGGAIGMVSAGDGDTTLSCEALAAARQAAEDVAGPSGHGLGKVDLSASGATPSA